VSDAASEPKAVKVGSVLTALVFLLAGSLKLFVQPEAATAQFETYGYADWFRIAIGACELAGAVGLIVPRVSWLAASGLSVLMLGAIYTHLAHGEIQSAAVPLVVLALLVYVAWQRRPAPPGPSSAM